MLDADEKYFKEHGEPLFSSHMIDLSEESKEENIAITKKYAQRMAPMKQWIEMVSSRKYNNINFYANIYIVQEIGITGGEEDGVDNTGVDNAALYTQPEDIYEVYEALSSVYPYFSIAAAFGNVHGVYKPGNVKLHPELLEKHQAYTKDKINAKEELPLFLVFHGGSGSTKQEFATAINSGVVKVNLDTDLQFAYLCGIRDYMLKKKVYFSFKIDQV